jgi:hypothetical protein
MVVSTVFSEMVLGFVKAVTQAVEQGEFERWSPEDARQFVAACLEVRLKVESLGDRVQQTLAEGVDVATFKATFGSLHTRWESLALEMEGVRGSVNKAGEMGAEFEPLVRAVTRVRDLLQRAFAAIASPHPSLDWQRIQDAQEAYRKGDTKPFQAAQERNGS